MEFLGYLGLQGEPARVIGIVGDAREKYQQIVILIVTCGNSV